MCYRPGMQDSALPGGQVFIFGEPPPAAAGQTRQLIRLPTGLRSKRQLLAVLADRLRFPAYFGWNWDALEECLHDLSWIPEGVELVLMHADLPFGRGENRPLYLQILAGAVKPGRLLACFPAEARDVVQANC